MADFLLSPRQPASFYLYRALFGISITSFAYLGYAVYAHKSRSSGLPLSAFSLIKPLLFCLDAERAHRYAVQSAQLPKWARDAFGMVYEAPASSKMLSTDVFGLTFSNPIGLAAGFDKHGECIDGMFDMGFGFVEIGSITPKPQLGNDKPRVWRLVKDEAVINRYGFNSEGHETVGRRLKHRLGNMERSSYGQLGVNLGKNKFTLQKDAAEDYVKGIEQLAEFADYLVVNVSSPNTPGLRDLQRRDVMRDLLARVKSARDRVHDENFAKSPMADCVKCKPPPPPLLVKIAPDLDDTQITDIAAVVKEVGIDGIIVSNTTIDREGLKSKESLASEYGGLSGKPLLEKSNVVLRKMYKATNGQIPLVGVGGVASVEDAYEKIKCGASLVQLYTGMVYGGPALIHDILDRLHDLASKDGYESVTNAIGTSVSD